MRYRVVITETNIDEDSHPEVVRYAVEAGSEAEATLKGRQRFAKRTGREPAARATIDVESLE
jgi:hypothetical protein